MSGWPLTVDKWPLLLSGPILRRVEPGSVSVFVALSHPRDVKLDIYDGQSPLTSTQIATVTTPARKIGASLYVSVVTAAIAPALQPGRVYGYDLSFQSTGNDPTDTFPPNRSLFELLLLQPPHVLGYETGKLPSFALPPSDLGKLRIVHASCRLASAQRLDALPALDQMISTAHNDADVRPHELFLTGDQIYADDVAPALLAHAMAIGEAALGWKEKVPVPAEVIPIGANPVTVTTDDVDLAPGYRGRLRKSDGVRILEAAHFSSEDQDSHLVTFAEFVGMYLLAWSDELWLSEADGFLPGIDDVYKKPTWTPQKDQAKSRFEGTFSNAVNMAKETILVRRALANVPTYMIFDDHEVSDDWNIDQDWKVKVEGNAFGVRLLSNALAAYAIFQAWGNDPAQFAAGAPGDAFIADIEAWRGDEKADPAVAKRIRARLALPDPAAALARLRWDYSLDRTSYRVIALDARTHRSFPAGDPGPRLLDPAALQSQITARLAGPAKELNIVIAPAPIFGLRLMEETIQRLLAKGGDKKRRNADFEAWSFNPAGFQETVRELAKADRVLILSGDVHYGFACGIDYYDEHAPVHRSRLVQLSSSGLKNEKGLTRLLGSALFDWLSSPKWRNFSTVPILSVFWWLFGTDNSFLGWDQPGPHLRLGAVTVNVDAPGVMEVPTAIADTIVDQPQWRFRTKFFMDERSEGDRAPATPALVPIPQTPAASYLETVMELARAQRSRHQFAMHRKIVGHNNLGDITFTWTGTTKSVKQALWFSFDPVSEPAAGPHTVYEVPFSAPGATKPDLSTP